MAQNDTAVAEPFTWNAQRSKAAVLAAEDRLSDEQIARRVRISRSQLARWKDHPDFQARVEELRRKLDDEARKHGVARFAQRIGALDDRWSRMRRVIDERARDPDMADIPGGPTGLLVRQRKAIGSGDAQEFVDEYAVDTGLLRELREAEKQAAQEVGHLGGGGNASGAGQPPLVVFYLPGQSPLHRPAPPDEVVEAPPLIRLPPANGHHP